MEAYDALVETVSKLEFTDDQKQALLAHAKTLNVELGSRGSDLIKFKNENGTLKQELDETKNSVGQYKKFADQLKEFNLSAEDVKKAADAAGIKQTYEDKLSEYETILKEREAKLSEASKKLKMIEAKEILKPKLDDAVKNFKDGEGKGFNFLQDFVDAISKDLYSGITDTDDEVIINDRINKALLKAKTDQENFMQRNNLKSVTSEVHKVEERGSAGSGPNLGINAQEIRKEYVEGGATVDAAALAIARLRNAQSKE